MCVHVHMCVYVLGVGTGAAGGEKERRWSGRALGVEEGTWAKLRSSWPMTFNFWHLSSLVRNCDQDVWPQILVIWPFSHKWLETASFYPSSLVEVNCKALTTRTRPPAQPGHGVLAPAGLPHLSPELAGQGQASDQTELGLKPFCSFYLLCYLV